MVVATPHNTGVSEVEVTTNVAPPVVVAVPGANQPSERVLPVANQPPEHVPLHLSYLDSTLKALLEEARARDQAEILRLSSQVAQLKEQHVSVRRVLTSLCNLHENVANVREDLVNLTCEIDTALN